MKSKQLEIISNVFDNQVHNIMMSSRMEMANRIEAAQSRELRDDETYLIVVDLETMKTFQGIVSNSVFDGFKSNMLVLFCVDSEVWNDSCIIGFDAYELRNGLLDEYDANRGRIAEDIEKYAKGLIEG